MARTNNKKKTVVTDESLNNEILSHRETEIKKPVRNFSSPGDEVMWKCGEYGIPCRYDLTGHKLEDIPSKVLNDIAEFENKNRI